MDDNEEIEVDVRNTSMIINEPPMNFGKFFPVSSKLSNFSNTYTVPNSGAVLWFQQFYAMFLKRLYNSIRFWQAIITQLVLPLLFVLIAMILAVTLPNANENDPSRSLTIKNSALDPGNQLVFFADFGENSSIDFGVSTNSLHLVL